MSYKLLFFCFFLCSCAASRMTETDLYFGRSKPGGGLVTENEWKDFKENRITGIFKDGSTVFDGAGSWYDPASHKLITEPVYVVVYFYKKSPQISRQIDSLSYWYKTSFHQQSVLRVDKKVSVRF